MSVFCDIELTAHDGFDFRGALFIGWIGWMVIGLGHELEHPEHVAVITDGQGRHVVLHRLFVQRLDRGSPVEQGILCVNVKV